MSRWWLAKEGVYKDVKWMWEVFGRHGSRHLGLGKLLYPIILIQRAKCSLVLVVILNQITRRGAPSGRLLSNIKNKNINQKSKNTNILMDARRGSWQRKAHGLLLSPTLVSHTCHFSTIQKHRRQMLRASLFKHYIFHADQKLSFSIRVPLKCCC